MNRKENDKDVLPEGGFNYSGKPSDYASEDKQKPVRKVDYGKFAGCGGDESGCVSREDLAGEVSKNAAITRREGESDDNYHDRMISYCANQIELMFRIENQKKLSRFSKLQKYLAVQLSSEDKQDIERAIEDYKSIISVYFETHPEFLDKENIRKKVGDLESLM
tara:strand:+ start:949 stop:1440 length:492 start_codon:yes stop_codon:yes gene_type:complete